MASPARRQRTRCYVDIPESLRERMAVEAEKRDMSMSLFISRLVEEAMGALKPAEEWRLTTLPTYDPTELEKTKVSAGPSKPCSTPIIRLRDRGYAYCPDCGWHVEMHLDA